MRRGVLANDHLELGRQYRRPGQGVTGLTGLTSCALLWL
jgi:hypothetical protein